MCAILGVLSPTEVERARFQAALDCLSHRGPDGEGRFEGEKVLLGHRRLAIIDLSHSGDQPMIDAATGVAIVFNGEIYNYIEVREELLAAGVQFRSGSDTEVLLQAYLKWGVDMLSRLNGMWAFGIWDPRTEALLLSRDRFGVKPLYYANVDGRLLFASEPKALFRLHPPLAMPSAAGILDFFAASEMHASADTFYEGVNSLPAASYAIVRPGQAEVSPRSYWAYPEGRAEDFTQDFDFESLFSSAVALRLRSDVPVGLTLSGGLDSSAILAACSEISPRPLQCFTSVYGSEQRGEEAWARKAADIAGAPLISVDSSLQDWHSTLELAVRHLDSPSYSSAIIPLWAIMKTAKAQGVTVLLEGQGADELLGGYPRYFPAMLAQMARAGGLRRMPANLSRLSRTFGWKWMMLWSLRMAMPGPYQAWSHLKGGNSLLRDDLGGSREPMTGAADGDLFQMLRADHSRKILPALLHYGDAIAMAHGVESRLPFMDYRLVEQVFRARPALMVDGRTKAPIRDYLDNHGFEVIANRMDKRGYPTPVMDWLRGLGGVFLRDTLADANNPIWDYLVPARVSALLTAAIAGSETAVFQLFKVATAAIWLSNTQAERVTAAGSAR